MKTLKLELTVKNLNLRLNLNPQDNSLHDPNNNNFISN